MSAWGLRFGAALRIGMAKARSLAASSSCAMAPTRNRSSATVKTKLADVQAGLPEGVEIEVAYDRSALIGRSVESLQDALIQQFAIVGLVCVLFLAHFRSALVAIMMLPVGVLMAFIAIYLQGLSINIMSLGGIAVAIGTMVDAGIVMVENAHKHLERDRGKKEHWQIIVDSSKEVGPSLFFSLLVITVSFMPVFTLEAQEGRLFKPLAFTKTYSMAAAAFLAVTLVPVLVGYWVRGRIIPEERNPLNRLVVAIYRPLLELVFRFRWPALVVMVLLLALTVPAYLGLGSEFMPPLWEGDLLYMPTTLPGVSITKAREILQQTDKIIKTFPEVHHVFGKIGRAETATDPAPLSMIETTITLKPEIEWREGMTPDKLIDEMNAAIQVPGLTNAWTMPIKTRIDMLSTGIKTPVGIKIAGPDLLDLERIGKEVELVMRNVPGTLSVYAERVMGGNYLDFDIDRKAIARYGLTVGHVQQIIQSAIGGMNITTTVEGLERYPVNLRYARELRDDLPALRSVLVPTPGGQQIPLGQLADIRYVVGPPGIKSENAKPNAWVYVDIRNIDVGSYVEAARKAVSDQITLPPGYTIAWSGQYEYMQRAQQRLMFVHSESRLLLIFVIIYLNTSSIIETVIVMLGVPFALIGSVWLLYLLNYNLSVAVWVGVIALAGLYAETAIVSPAVSRSVVSRAQRTGSHQRPKQLDSSDLRRLRAKSPSDPHDGRHGRHRPVADHVEHGYGRRRDEAHRYAAGGRHSDFRIHRARDYADRLLPVARHRSPQGREVQRLPQSQGVVIMILRTITLCIVVASAGYAQSSFEVVRKKPFWPNAKGTLVIGDEGIEFRREKEEDTKSWSYREIQSVDRISPTEIEILTYEDVAWRFGAGSLLQVHTVLGQDRRRSL